MRTVLTGSTGFIGSRVRRRLHEASLPTVAVSRSEDATDPGRHVADLANPATLLPSTNVGEPFTLIHLAWVTDRSACFTVQAEQVRQLSGLLDYWSERGLQRVILLGSAEEYGTRGGSLSELDEPQGSQSPYGWSKRASWRLAQAWSARTGIPTIWLRPFIVYGPGQSGNMLIPYAVRQASLGEPALFSDGRQRRDFVYVADVADAILAASRWTAPGFHTFNLGTGNAVAVRDVVTYLADLFQPAVPFQLGAIAARPGEPAVQIADPHAAAHALDWRATTDWRDGLRKVWEWVRAGQRRSA